MKQSQTLIVNARFLTQRITGVQRFAIEISKILSKNFSDIKFIAPNNIMHNDIADLLNVECIGKLKNGFLWEQIELPIYLKKLGSPVLLNLGNVAPVYYNNNIVSVMDLSFHHHPEWFSKKFTLLYNTIIPLILKRSKGIVTISKYSKSDICKIYNIDAQRVQIMYPKLSEGFCSSDAISDIEYERKYNNYILAVSSLDPRKNFKRLIIAFKACNIPGMKLVIVGASHKLFSSDVELHNIVNNDPSIVFTGYVNDFELMSLYTNATLFAYPSLFEGFGLPPLEAMACGCVTLVSNITSLPEICSDASIYVNPYSIESITEGLLLGIYNQDLREKMILNGFERVKFYQNNNSVSDTISMIYQLMQR